MQCPDPGFHFDGSSLALFLLAVCFFFGIFTLIDMFRSWREMSRIQRELDELEREIYEAGDIPAYLQSFRTHDQ